MHDGRLLSPLPVSSFYYQKEKKIVSTEVNPQKISSYIKSTIRSYLSCSQVNWKRALFTLLLYIPDTLVTHLSALSKSTLIPNKGIPLTPLGMKRENVCQEADTIFTLLSEGKPDFSTCCFAFAWTLHKWTDFHTFQPLVGSAQYDFTTCVTSSSEAGANGYHTREVWRALIHSHRK